MIILAIRVVRRRATRINVAYHFAWITSRRIMSRDRFGHTGCYSRSDKLLHKIRKTGMILSGIRASRRAVCTLIYSDEANISHAFFHTEFVELATNGIPESIQRTGNRTVWDSMGNTERSIP